MNYTSPTTARIMATQAAHLYKKVTLEEILAL